MDSGLVRNFLRELPGAEKILNPVNYFLALYTLPGNFSKQGASPVPPPLVPLLMDRELWAYGFFGH
jgi:hypothetical protein